MPRAFVMNAFAPRGGALMAYHVGRIAQLHFGYRAVAVQTWEPGPPVYDYDTAMEHIPLEALLREAKAEDVAIINPSFSEHLLGLKLPCRTLSYVQDFTTYRFLDCHFGLYVSVSSVVRDFLRATYGIETAVVPPFIAAGAQEVPWEAKAEAMLVHCKEPERPEYRYLAGWLGEALPEMRLVHSGGYRRSHAEFLRLVAEHRYLFNLTIAEGFGLPPLEAFALGTVVTGLDGLSGRDYMRPGENCLTVPFRELRALPERWRALMAAPEAVARMRAQARVDAQAYGYGRFEAAWREILARWL